MHESESETNTHSSKTKIVLRQIKKVNNPNSIHGIYPYRGKMSAIDAAHVISQFPAESTLLDPFCGTGTIVYEAQSHGMNAIGVDNNPLACIIASGKTEPIDEEFTLAHLSKTIDHAKSLSNNQNMPISPARYFHPETANQIMRLLISSADFSPYLRSCLYGSICLAARACNGWLWTSTSIGKINPPLRKVDFYSMLLRKATKHIKYVKGKPPVRIHHHDTRNIQEIIPSSSIDIVYTSPPYFDALDYTGYYTKLVMEILEIDRAEVRKGLIQRYSSYKEEMKKALHAIDKVLNDEAVVIFVVGDRMVHKRLIRGSDFFTEIAPWTEPYFVEREYTKTASGLWDKINTTNRKEQVIVWDMSFGGRK